MPSNPIYFKPISVSSLFNNKHKTKTMCNQTHYKSYKDSHQVTGAISNHLPSDNLCRCIYFNQIIISLQIGIFNRFIQFGVLSLIVIHHIPPNHRQTQLATVLSFRDPHTIVPCEFLVCMYHFAFVKSIGWVQSHCSV